jgi:hypothetical protein
LAPGDTVGLRLPPDVIHVFGADEATLPATRMET